LTSIASNGARRYDASMTTKAQLVADWRQLADELHHTLEWLESGGVSPTHNVADTQASIARIRASLGKVEGLIAAYGEPDT